MRTYLYRINCYGLSNMIGRIESSEHAMDVEGFTVDDNERVFTERQDAAINLLATGYSVADAAAVLGISRSIVDKWRNRNPAFERELIRRRREIGAPQRRAHNRHAKL
jgi:Homeodomain-like domain